MRLLEALALIDEQVYLVIIALEILLLLLTLGTLLGTIVHLPPRLSDIRFKNSFVQSKAFYFVQVMSINTSRLAID